MINGSLRDATARMNHARQFIKPRKRTVLSCGHSKGKTATKDGLCNTCLHRARLGVTPVVFREKLMQQDWRCLICTEEVNISSSLDHDHETGDVRGVLCAKCNWLLGHASDNPDRLRAAADYVEYFGALKGEPNG